MDFDVFFSVSQTPVAGKTPSEAEMYRNFLAEVEAADRLGFGVAWIAESHLSSEVQKRNRNPVIPHWQGEVGLNVDFLQTAACVFARTRRIECGSAIMNVVYGSPIVAAERVAAFLALHGLDPEERRRIHVGFAAGRFEFMNRATGIVPRDPIEEAAWPVVKGLVFKEAAEIFCRLLRGDVLESQDIEHPVLAESMFRRPADWKRVQEVAKTTASTVPLRRRWEFEALQIVPKEFRRDLLQLTAGSHDPEVQAFVNTFLPVRVFNLSITQPEVIEATHARMREAYHPDGGPWKRSYMPRTTFVFLDATPGRSPERQREVARERARMALGAYWTALEGTLDPSKVENAADNALVGNPDDVAKQILDRFHPEDRLMLWFDFFEHDAGRVISDMEAFVAHVAPRVNAALGTSP